MDKDRSLRLFDRLIQVYLAIVGTYAVYLARQSIEPTASHLGFIKGGIMRFVPSISAPSVLIVTTILLAIVNYVLRRKGARATPTVGLTLREKVMDPYVAGLYYPRKLTLYCSNDGDDIHLGEAKWIKDQVGLQADKPPRIMYLLKPNPSGQWQSEENNKFVSSGRWVKIWVGLDSFVQESDLTQLAKDRRLGTVEIPAEISGTAIKIRIPL
jgi:hypothetical protein